MKNIVVHMNKNLAELQLSVEQLVNDAEFDPLNEIAKDTGFSKKFVKYVLDVVDVHYNDATLLKHMVAFVASQLPCGTNLHSNNISANEFRSIAPLCAQLKNDSAFSIGSDKNDSDALAGEFALLTRFAIVATYCASYNPQVTDRRFFFTGKDVLRRKSRTVNTPARRTVQDKWHESGPRPFDHQRAMFIFLYFCKEFDEQLLDGKDEVDSQVDFTSQLTYLVEAGLLQIVSSPENLDLPKYRSLCSLGFVQKIASSISPELMLERKYLYDFATD